MKFLFRLFLGKRLPLTEGRIKVAGPRGSIRIHRDQFGIPLIEADHPLDGAFAIGFCHGQDRAFQLEILARVGRGTLCELVGPAALPIDRLSRRIGFHRTAREQLPIIDQDIRDTLRAYSEGVNAGSTVGCPRPPHEFALLGGRPSAWTPEDTLAVTKVMSFTLCCNWDAELTRLKVLTSDGPEALQALDASYASWHPVTDPPGEKVGAVLDHLSEEIAAFLGTVKPGGGSNNWVVAASRTATGRPILANDPHLDASLPAHWYLARVATRDWTVVGATFPGAPSVLSGHNGHSAWGLTAGLVDNTDLFLEEIGPDGKSVRQGKDWQACPIAEEVISIKGGKSVIEPVLLTPRGPIISPALAETTQALSLRATWLDPLPIAGFLRIHPVKSIEDLQQAFAQWPSSTQNLVYADTTGTIGWQLVGRVPRRKAGHGVVPLPGWIERNGWHDDGATGPGCVNPPCGWIATANNKPVSDNRGVFLGVDWIDGYRVTAIGQALAARSDHDIASTMRLQTDQHAVAWAEMREVVLKETNHPLLREWNGDTGGDSPAAAVYELFLTEMIRRVARAKAPRSWEWVVGRTGSALTAYNFNCFRRTAHLVKLLREQPTGWFAQPWGDEIRDALAGVERDLTAKFGGDVSAWKWGKIRPLLLHHPLTRAGALGKALGGIFNLGPVPMGGDADVINQAAVLPLNPLAPADNIASLRTVIDVGAWHNSRFVLPGGQSGNPLSPNYGDLFPLWQRGEGVPIAFTAQEVEKAKVKTLEIVLDWAPSV